MNLHQAIEHTIRDHIDFFGAGDRIDDFDTKDINAPIVLITIGKAIYS